MPWLLSIAVPGTPPHARLVMLWMGVAFLLVILPFVVLAIRRATLGSPRSDGRRPRRAGPPPPDAWTEAGRRVRSEPGRGRLDDTVDLDPFDPDDEDRW